MQIIHSSFVSHSIITLLEKLISDYIILPNSSKVTARLEVDHIIWFDQVWLVETREAFFLGIQLETVPGQEGKTDD